MADINFNVVTTGIEKTANKSTDVDTDKASNTKYPTVKAVYDWVVGLFVQKNADITAATKTKITYDVKGLVTAGADATTADIADSSNKRYVTDANLVVIGNTSGTNTGDQTISDATIVTSDITTNNVSITKHGFAPKAPNDATKFLDGLGAWSTPTASFAAQAKNLVYAGPAIGTNATPTFRALTNFDLANENKAKGMLVGTPVAYGDSFTVGQQSSPSTESYINKLVVYNGVTITNAAVGGTGVLQACLASFTNENQTITTISSSAIWMSGFNDLRRNGSAATTLLKIKGCLRSAIANHFLLYGGVSAASVVTNSGSWSNITGILDKSAASAIGNARQSSTSGNTLTYTSPISSNIVIGTFNTDGVTYDYGRFTVTIDGTIVATFDPNGRTDLVSDGTYDNGRTHEALIFEGLRNTAHTVVVTLLDSKTTVVDYFGVMASGLINQPMFVVSVPKMNATGYAISPANGSDAAFDAGDVAIKAVVDEFQFRPVFYCALNNYFDVATGVGADNIHPNNLGYTQIFQAIQANIRSFVTPSKIPSIAAGVNVYQYNQNQYVLGINRNLAGTSDNVALTQAQMTISAGNLDSNFQFFTSATNNTTQLALKITKNANIEASNNVDGYYNIGTVNKAYYGISSHSAIWSINRSIAGTFTDVNKASAEIRLVSANASGTIQFYASTANNGAPTICGNINANGRWFIGGSTSATARLELPAGTATASTAPLKLTSGTNLTTPEAGAIEFDGTNYFVTSSTTRYTLAKTLTATATLDFGSTAASSSTDLTITVTGAADGDSVIVTPPNGSIVANSIYTARVSAANTVTVRFSNLDILTAADPASGTFRAVVFKY